MARCLAGPVPRLWLLDEPTAGLDRAGAQRLVAELGRPVSGRRVLAAVGIGLAGELSALGLLATGGWLLLSASLRPPILLLSIAIGAVQLFSLLRGTARYAERLASHDLGLRVQAGLRGWLYRRLEHLVPAGLPGGDRGDLLARLVRDTEEAQDLVVRIAVRCWPRWSPGSPRW